MLSPEVFTDCDCCTVTDTLVRTSSSSFMYTVVSVSLCDVVSSGDWDCNEFVLLWGDRLMVENCSLSWASGRSSAGSVSSSVTVSVETTSTATIGGDSTDGGASTTTGAMTGDSLGAIDCGLGDGSTSLGSLWLNALIRCAIELRAGFAGGCVLSLKIDLF